MKKNHSFELSILALSVLLAFIIYSYNIIFPSCSSDITPYVTTGVSAETLSASTGTKLPLMVSLINEGSKPVSNGSLVLVVFHEETGALIYSGEVKTGISLNSNEMATTSVFWEIPASLYASVYRIQGLLVVDGYALKGKRVLTNTPFGNTAKLYISGDENGSIPTPNSDLPHYADYTVHSCNTYNMLPAWAMAIGGLGTLMLLLLVRRKKNHIDNIDNLS